MRSETIQFLATAAFLVLCGAGFLLLLRARDRSRAPDRGRAQPSPSRPPSAAPVYPAVGVYALKPGATYRVLQPFSDYHQGQFIAGEELVFVGRDYLPYHGGHTLTFTTRKIYLQDEEHAMILARLESYLTPV